MGMLRCGQSVVPSYRATQLKAHTAARLQSTYLVDDKLSLADIGIWGAIKSKGVSGSIPSNVKVLFAPWTNTLATPATRPSPLFLVTVTHPVSRLYLAARHPIAPFRLPCRFAAC